eukprot:CAMPEP_0119395516 /NCGR_PEP_ID=MMETSP1334-20130426/133582_1 /TAXON_ID=127549 /ORGANISM="Calcidiscus leptoporus, Strain RCC1130" /LENGTH=200 /DNA_ID=CAMNT_0007419011 /DNA_START=133 /DNA_END=735 /DNA_ORIENTATION=+
MHATYARVSVSHSKASMLRTALPRSFSADGTLFLCRRARQLRGEGSADPFTPAPRSALARQCALAAQRAELAELHKRSIAAARPESSSPLPHEPHPYHSRSFKPPFDQDAARWQAFAAMTMHNGRSPKRAPCAVPIDPNLQAKGFYLQQAREFNNQRAWQLNTLLDLHGPDPFHHEPRAMSESLDQPSARLLSRAVTVLR